MIKQNASILRLSSLVVSVFFSLAFMMSLNASTLKTDMESRNWTSGTMSHGGYLMVGNEKVFCVQPGVIFKSDKTYIPSSRPYYINDEQQKIFELISYYGTDIFNGERYWAATQSLIWSYLDETVEDATFSVDGKKVTQEMNEIMDKVNKHYIKPSFDSKTITLEENVTYELVDNNNVLDNFELISNNGFTIEKNNNKLYITASKNSPQSATFKLENRANFDKGSTTWFKLSGSSDTIYYSGWQRCAKLYVSDIVSSEFHVKVIKNGELEINKSSNNLSITLNNANYSLDQAKYGIYSDKNCENLIQEVLLKNGNSEIISLYPNTYYVKEIQAPLGYSINNTIYSFIIEEEKKYTLHVDDVPQYMNVELLLQKVDSITNKPLKDAVYEFKFYENKDSTNPLKTWYFKTDQEGKIYLKDDYKVSGDELYYDEANAVLPLGYMTIVENKAPEGYILDKSTYSIDLTEHQIYNFPLIKEIQNQLKIKKIDRDSKLPIPNVEFVHTLPDKSTNTIKTDNEGFITLNALSIGKHQIAEINQSSHYQDNSEIYEFEVLDNGQIISDEKCFEKDENGNAILTIENQLIKGKIEIYKTGDVLTAYNDINFIYEEKPLKDVVFELYASTDIYDEKNAIIYSKDELVEKLTTNVNGYANSQLLPLGKYYLKEIKTNDDYIIDEKIHEVELSKRDEKESLVCQSLHLNNIRKKTQLMINKADSSNLQPLRGAIFGLYNAVDIYNNEKKCIVLKDTLLEIIETDENGIGKGKINLPNSQYYIRELEAPNGYQINNQVYEMDTNLTNELTILNDVKVSQQSGDNANLIKYLMTGVSSLAIIIYIGFKAKRD